MPTAQPMVVTPTQNVGIAILLAAVLGPLGMLYSTIRGALLMMALNFILVLATIIVFDGSVWFLPFLLTWPGGMIVAARASQSYNENLMRQC